MDSVGAEVPARRPIAVPVVWMASIVAALGGVLFGYDTGVVSMALLYLTPAFHLSTVMQQVVVASLLVGAVIGVPLGGPIADRVGRKPTLLAVTVVFAGAAIACATAPDIATLVGARIVLGSAIGTSSVVVPTYIAEMAPADQRGALVSLHQLMVTVGILVSYLVGYGYSGSGQWRWMLGWAVAPAAAMFLGLLSLPESPRWFVAHQRHSEAMTVLTMLRGATRAAGEYAEIAEAVHAEKRITYRDLLGRRYRRRIAVGTTVAATSQFIGVNAVIYYAPTILRGAGFGGSAAILASVGIGSLNVVSTVAAVLLIDRLGRRPLILGGTLVMIAALVTIGVLFRFPLHGSSAVVLVCMLIVYQAAFACSLGIAIWLINSELFPTVVRGKAASFGIVAHWGPDFVVSVSVLSLIGAITASGVFWLYAALGATGLCYLYRRLPETKNRTLEEIEADQT